MKFRNGTANNTLIDFVAALTSIITGYHQRITKIEEEKYDCEMEVARRELEVCLGLSVNAILNAIRLSSSCRLLCD